MIRLYVSGVLDFSGVATEELRGLFSSRGLAKSENLRNPRIRNASLTAELLLRTVTGETEPGAAKPREIGEESEGKPYFADGGGPAFSLSHSGGYVLCAVGDGRLGADIQQVRPLKVDIASRFYTADEIDAMRAAPDPDREFFRIWVRKESFVKYTGKGLAAGLNRFSVFRQSEEYRLTVLPFADCFVGVCAKEPIDETIRFLVPEDLGRFPGREQASDL